MKNTEYKIVFIMFLYLVKFYIEFIFCIICCGRQMPCAVVLVGRNAFESLEHVLMGLSRKQVVMVVVLIFGTFVAVLNQTVVTPMLPSVMAEMSVDASTAQWLTTGFTLVNAIMIPITAFFTDKYPVRKLFCIAMSIFVAGSLLAGWGPNFGVLLAGRMVQAAGAGILQPLVMTVLLKTFPVERRGTAMGIFGLVIGFAPAVGPTAAGFVIDTLGWHILFYVIALLSLLVVVIAMATLEKGDAVNPDATLDIPSVILSCLGFGGLLYGLSSIGSYGFDVVDVAITLVGIVALVFFFHRQLHLDEPMLEVRVLKNRRYLISTIITMLVQASLMVGTVLLPIYMQNDLGMSATESGLVMMPAAIIMGIMGLVSGSIFDRRGPRVMSIVGLVIVTVATLFFARLDLNATLVYLMVLYAVRMFGLSLVNMPINTWGMNALPTNLINHGTALGNTFRQVAGSFGTALLVSVSTAATNSQAGQMSDVEASVFGINMAFAVGVAICAVGLVLTIVFVKDKPAKKADGGASPKLAHVSDELAVVIKPDVYTIPATATVLDAMRMITDKGIASVVIVDKQGRVVGVVSDGDIMRYLAQHDEYITDPMSMITVVLKRSGDGRELGERFVELMQMNVSVVSRKNVLMLNASAGIDELQRLMSTKHIKKVPVVDADKKLVGIIDRSDVVRYAMSQYVEKAEAE